MGFQAQQLGVVMTCRWSFHSPVKQSKMNWEILDFYLWGTPVNGVSQKGRSFADIGITGGKFNTLRGLMKAESHTGASLIEKNWVATTIKQIPDKLFSIGQLDSIDWSNEFAVHAVGVNPNNRGKSLNKTETLFYLVRNSLAHGGFRIAEYEGDFVYAFENRLRGVIRGRAVLYEGTLLNWARIIKKWNRRYDPHR